MALLIACASLFTCTAPGRIGYPDDEIVYQTTASIYERGSLAIEGIPRRTGEHPSRPTGTFGWAPGRDGERYGFFGHGLSIVALPMYALGKVTLDHVPPLWRHAIRSDLFVFHPRTLTDDWLRLVVSLTNSLLTPFAALLLGLWARELGHGLRVSVVLASIYALATTAWPYSGTFVSEPLSTVLLLGSALAITRWRHERRRDLRAATRQLALAATLAGLSVHVHLLNLVAIPCLLGYAALPSLRERELWSSERRAWILALVLGSAGFALLLYGQWWRYGDPFESGRYHHYARWIWPFEALATTLIAPGRSVFLFSPPIALALLWWPAFWRRDRELAGFVLALVLIRLLLFCSRSDWHGGWGLGPRYFVPVIPFLLLPLLEPLSRWRELPKLGRIGFVAFISASTLLQAWLALHSIFQVLWSINHRFGREHYWKIADWQLWASPPIAYWELEQKTFGYLRAGKWTAARSSAQVELLSMGSWRVAAASGERGLFRIMQAIGLLGLCAGASLGWLLRRDRNP